MNVRRSTMRERGGYEEAVSAVRVERCQVCGGRAMPPAFELCSWCEQEIGAMVAEPCA